MRETLGSWCRVAIVTFAAVGLAAFDAGCAGSSGSAALVDPLRNAAFPSSVPTL